MSIKSKKILLLVFLLFLPVIVFAKSGCCSRHGGVVGCYNGYDLCADGTTSSCTCGSVNDGSSKKSNNGGSYNGGSGGNYRYYPKQEEKDNDINIFQIIILLFIFMPIIYPILEFFGFFIKPKNSKNNKNYTNNINNSKDEVQHINQKSEKRTENITFSNSPSYDKSFDLKVDKVNERKKITNASLYDDPSIKYDKLTIIYNNLAVQCMIYTYTNASQYSPKNKPVYMHNLSKNLSAYNLYKEGIFNLNLVATFNSSDITIIDKNKIIRKTYNLDMDRIITKHLLKQKIKLGNNEKSKVKIMINNINGNKKLLAEISLDQLLLLSRLCQNIKIEEF